MKEKAALKSANKPLMLILSRFASPGIEVLVKLSPWEIYNHRRAEIFADLTILIPPVAAAWIEFSDSNDVI